MIRARALQMHPALKPAEIALCDRVFDHICAQRQITLDMYKEDVADRVIDAYRHGVRDEGALIRLLS